MTWTTVTLGELCDEGGGEIRTGPFGSQLHESDYSDHGIPVVMPKDISTGRIDETSVARVSQNHVDRLSQHRLLIGDIVYGRRGDIGRRALVGEREAGWLCGTGCLRISPGGEAVDSQFLFYRLGESSIVADIRNRAIGATMPNLNTSILRDTVLTIPSVNVQRRIAGVLGAYDDLIEVNRRHIALLEETARALFEEWFVRFRFPGHENVVINDTPDGSLPEGWRFAPLTDACVFQRGRSYRSAELSESEGLPFVNLKCIVRDGGFRSSGLKRYTGQFRPHHIVRHEDIVLAVTDMTQERRIVGRVARIPLLEEPEAVISMDLVKVEPLASINRVYLYAWLAYSEFGATAAGYANGANVLHLSPTSIAPLPALLPPEEIQIAYGEVVGPMLTLAETLSLAEGRLQAARDLLLPRLISGELSLAATESQVQQASASELMAAE
jgi:type I restriction enzyme S subunit